MLVRAGTGDQQIQPRRHRDTDDDDRQAVNRVLQPVDQLDRAVELRRVEHQGRGAEQCLRELVQEQDHAEGGQNLI